MNWNCRSLVSLKLTWKAARWKSLTVQWKPFSGVSPVMLVEVNHPVLARLGYRWEDIRDRADKLNYRVELADPRYGLDSNSTDVYLIPK